MNEIHQDYPLTNDKIKGQKIASFSNDNIMKG